MTAPSLPDFLLARIAEDEAAAKAISAGAHEDAVAAAWHGASDHVDRWSPARVLTECEAKRRIVEMHAGVHECVGWKYGRWDTVYVHPNFAFRHDPTLRLLALPYAEHPDFDPEWAS